MFGYRFETSLYFNIRNEQIYFFVALVVGTYDLQKFVVAQLFPIPHQYRKSGLFFPGSLTINKYTFNINIVKLYLEQNNIS